MKTIINFFLILLISIFLFSCSNEKEFRVKTLKENIVINIESPSNYRKGDTVQITVAGRGNWLINQNPITLKDTSYYLFIRDSSRILISKKVAVIEEIIE